MGEDLRSKLISEGVSNVLEKREKQEVRDKKARKKEDTAHGRGTPSSKVWLGLEPQDGKRGSGNDEQIPGDKMHMHWALDLEHN